MNPISMRRRLRYAAFFIVGSAAVLGLFVHSHAQTTPRRVRQVNYRLGVPIEQRLLPDDEVVVIMREQHGAVFDPEPTAAEFLSYLADSSDAAVVLSVESVTSELLENRSWIGMRVTGSVNDVLMSDGRWPMQNGRVTIEYGGGGELQIGRVMVRTGTPLKLETKRTYLVFLDADPRGMRTLLAAMPLLIEDGRLINPLQIEANSTTRDPLHQSSFDEVRARLAKAVR